MGRTVREARARVSRRAHRARRVRRARRAGGHGRRGGCPERPTGRTAGRATPRTRLVGTHSRRRDRPARVHRRLGRTRRTVDDATRLRGRRQPAPGGGPDSRRQGRRRWARPRRVLSDSPRGTGAAGPRAMDRAHSHERCGDRTTPGPRPGVHAGRTIAHRPVERRRHVGLHRHHRPVAGRARHLDPVARRVSHRRRHQALLCRPPAGAGAAQGPARAGS